MLQKRGPFRRNISSEVRRFIRDLPAARVLYGLLLRMRDWLTLRVLRSWNPRGAFIEREGIKVFCDFKNTTSLWYVFVHSNLHRDAIVLERLSELVSGNVFVDVGAHFGFYARFFGERLAARLAGCRIIAIEPDRSHFACTQRTLGGELPFAVTLLNAAASDTKGVVPMSRSPHAPCMRSFDAPGASVVETVECITVDETVMDSLSASDSVGLVKIDVDGFEPRVLQGMEHVILRYKPMILMEFSASDLEAAGESPSAFLRWLLERFSVIHLGLEEVRIVEDADMEMLAESSRSNVTDLLLLSDHDKLRDVLGSLQMSISDARPATA